MTRAVENDTPCESRPGVDVCVTHWCWVCDEDHCPDDARGGK